MRRIVGALVILVPLLVWWNYCVPRTTGGRFALRVQGAGIDRHLEGPAEAEVLWAFDSANPGFDLRLVLDSALDMYGLPRAWIALHTSWTPGNGVYRVMGPGQSPIESGTLHVQLREAKAKLIPNVGPVEAWTPVGGTVQFERPYWLPTAVNGTFHILIARQPRDFDNQRLLKADTLTLSGWFKTR